jgi:hypothetical protein
MVEEIPAAQCAASVAMAVGAILFLFGAPSVLAILVFRARDARRSMAHLWSLAANSFALIVVCLILRQTVGLGRESFLLGWLSWSIGLATLACRAGQPWIELRDLWKRYQFSLCLGLVTVIFGTFLFRTEQFIQCFNGDGVESFELSRSLGAHVLPTWEIEPIDRFGAVIVNPALVNSYWTHGLQLLLGENELATRLSYWVYSLGILLVCLRLARRFGRLTWAAATVLALSVLLSTLWYTFYVGYYPYMTDLANPGVPDALFTLFLLLSFDALLQRDETAWIAATILGSLVLYAGPVMFVLTVAAALIWRPMERKNVVRGATIGTACLAGIAGLYLLWGWKEGLLAGWWAILHEEYVLDYIAPLPRIRGGFVFAGYLILGCGGLPAFALVGALMRSRWERTVATVVVAYLAIILGSAAKNLHYLGPLLPLVVLLWLISQARAGHQYRQYRTWLTVASIGICLVLCWPRSRPTFTLNRELGANTTYQTNSYEDACRWADVVLLYDLGVTSWPAGPHVWLAYSKLEAEPSERRPVLVTMAAGPPGYVLRAESELTGLKLYLDANRSDWLRWAATRRPESGPDRFPWVFQPIAIRTRPKFFQKPAR